MKILFIANNQTNDFLSDAVFHGLASLPAVEVVDYNRLWYMYNDVSPTDLLTRFHGRGFTYYASLPPRQVDRSNISEKIKSKYFDVLVYGNVERCSDFLEEAMQTYTKNQIILLDGEDLFVGDVYTIKPIRNVEVYDYCTVYKRESFNGLGSEKSISFAFPEEKMQQDYPKKEKLLAHIIPGVPTTYIFNNERDYFEDYQKSMFAYTWRKAGWDCLRHYEILCNNCIPLFLDIEQCPAETCTTLPKALLLNYYKSSGIYDLFQMNKPFTYDAQGTIITNRDLTIINNLDIDSNFFEKYIECLEELSKYARNKLTTKQLAQQLVNNIRNTD